MSLRRRAADFRTSGGKAAQGQRTPTWPHDHDGRSRVRLKPKSSVPRGVVGEDVSDPSFAKRIALMNAMYKLPAQETPVLPADPADRLRKFKATLLDEVNEIDDIVAACEGQTEPIDILVAVADLLGDVIVYCRSEALKFGLPLEDVLAIIMDSNESKLGADGKPIYDANGKFLKGPNYWKPEPKIKALLQSAVSASRA